jgi:hypothetical protein
MYTVFDPSLTPFFPFFFFPTIFLQAQYWVVRRTPTHASDKTGQTRCST